MKDFPQVVGLMLLYHYWPVLLITLLLTVWATSVLVLRLVQTGLLYCAVRT